MRVNKLALGTAQFGMNYGVSNRIGKVSNLEGTAIISTARKAKITFIDTAIAYGDSEKALGKIDVHDFNIVTKLPSLPSEAHSTVEWVDEQVLNSIDRLGVKSIYGLLLHQPKDLFGERSLELIKALEALKANGLVKKIGLSIYEPCELSYALKLLKVDLVQLPYNVVDRRFETNGWLSKLKDAGIEVHTRSTFLQGLLLLSAKDLPPMFNYWHKTWEKWEAFSKTNNMCSAKICLDFVFSNHNIDKIIVGVVNRKQLTEIIQISNSYPSDLDCIFMSSTDERLILPSNWV